MQATQNSTSLIKLDGIWFKREDENVTGSIKDRGLGVQIKNAAANNQRHLVISSSGNAAISAAYFCQRFGLRLTAFVSPRINPRKLELLKNLTTEIEISENALGDSLAFAQKNRLRHLRQSIDTMATIGYREIAFELHGAPLKGSTFESLFVPASSGTSLVGIDEGFRDLQQQGKLDKLPRFHVVQTAAVHPIASLFDQNFRRKARSLADAIVARQTPRQTQVAQIIKETGGFGWVMSDAEILTAQKWLRAAGVVTSHEGAMALGAVWRAQERDFDLGQPLVLLTGRAD